MVIFYFFFSLWISNIKILLKTGKNLTAELILGGEVEKEITSSKWEKYNLQQGNALIRFERGSQRPISRGDKQQEFFHHHCLNHELSKMRRLYYTLLVFSFFFSPPSFADDTVNTASRALFACSRMIGWALASNNHQAFQLLIRSSWILKGARVLVIFLPAITHAAGCLVWRIATGERCVELYKLGKLNSAGIRRLVVIKKCQYEIKKKKKSSMWSKRYINHLKWKNKKAHIKSNHRSVCL